MRRLTGYACPVKGCAAYSMAERVKCPVHNRLMVPARQAARRAFREEAGR